MQKESLVNGLTWPWNYKNFWKEKETKLLKGTISPSIDFIMILFKSYPDKTRINAQSACRGYNFISNFVTDYIQKRRGEPGLFSFEYVICYQNWYQIFMQCMDQATVSIWPWVNKSFFSKKVCTKELSLTKKDPIIRILSVRDRSRDSPALRNLSDDM